MPQNAEDELQHQRLSWGGAPESAESEAILGGCSVLSGAFDPRRLQLFFS